MAVTLKVTEGPHEGTEFTYKEHASFIVGRSVEVAFPMPMDLFLSRFHFIIECNPPACYLRDLGSRNGTKVNDQLVATISLKNNDCIKAGGSSFLVKVTRDDGEDVGPIYCRGCGTAAPLDLSISVNPNDDSPPEWNCPKCAEELQKFPSPPPGFVIEELIGNGGMGEVYKARNKSTNMLSAIKCVIPSIAASQKAKDYFRREMNVLRNLQHPNIVSFRGIFENKGQFLLIMEYVDGIDGMRWLQLQPNQRPPIETVAWIGVKLLEALGHAHSKGYVHRDVKPSNILLSGGGEYPLVKLTDFGLAKNYRDNAGFTGLTLQGDIGGSIGFIAPEHISNFKNVQEHSDIYSAGATLYYLLTGEYPILNFDPKRPDAYIMVLEHPPVPLRARRSDAPEGLDSVLRKALRKQPDRRWATAMEMANALRPWLPKATQPPTPIPSL